jgi:hypothetical protein
MKKRAAGVPVEEVAAATNIQIRDLNGLSFEYIIIYGNRK